jgi:hypothetical protein
MGIWVPMSASPQRDWPPSHPHTPLRHPRHTLPPCSSQNSTVVMFVRGYITFTNVTVFTPLSNSDAAASVERGASNMQGLFCMRVCFL